MHELRRLLPARQQGFGQSLLGQGLDQDGSGKTLPFGLAALDDRLPRGGLPCGALHEIVPATEGALPAAFGFIVALLARLVRTHPFIFVLPAYERRRHGRLSGHGLNSLGLDPSRAILVEPAHRNETLWAMAEAVRSAAPQAVVGSIDQLDLKTSQKLHLAASDAGLPLLLLRPARTLEASAAATRWRIGTAEAARDRFGAHAHPRWHLQLERCRNGQPGEWVVEYDHVAHRFSLATALADPAFSRGAGDRAAGPKVLHAILHAGRS
ncbi:MAG TPA: ImuA protein [Xanthobacteraceae bacterium]|jgi:protein ImuA|nr:ImuA protein [Xanthobacteraceae bacterium]